MEPQFNLRALIGALGGVYRLPERFREAGMQPPPVSTLLGWKRRNSCPGHWALALLDLARRDPDMPELDALLDLMWDGR
jgi:hypothetical protein